MQAWGSCSVFIVCRVLLQSVSRVSHSKPGGGRCRRGDPAVYLLFVVCMFQSVSRVSHSKPGGGRCRRGDRPRMSVVLDHPDCLYTFFPCCSLLVSHYLHYR